MSCCWTARPASTWRSGISDLTVQLATTESVDAEELAAVAAQAFPLACPTSTTPENIAAFIDANLSAARFGEFLNDPHRAIITARRDGRIVGYAMLVRGASGDNTAELSKLYVLADFHSQGVATMLMDAALAVGADWGLDHIWLGVNQENARAQRFYAKSGFTISGTRTFRLGEGLENDYVMVRRLGRP